MTVQELRDKLAPLNGDLDVEICISETTWYTDLELEPVPEDPAAYVPVAFVALHAGHPE